MVLLRPLRAAAPLEVLLEVFAERGGEDECLELAGAHAFFSVFGLGFFL